MLTSNPTLWSRIHRSKRLFLIGGPCVIEGKSLCLGIARSLKKTCDQLGIVYIFKASYDKANRSSGSTFRGPGVQEGLQILREIRDTLGVSILTDVHSTAEATEAGRIADILQIPAFLCRQTDLVVAAAKTGKIVNVKKGQFLAPQDMVNIIQKAVDAGNSKLILTERGTTFGYHNLVADMRSIPIMKGTGFPVVFDATHSIQLPGAGGDRSTGQREFAPVLARCAIAAGADGIFIETHPHPEKALSDGPNMIHLSALPKLLKQLVALKAILNA